MIPTQGSEGLRRNSGPRAAVLSKSMDSLFRRRLSAAEKIGGPLSRLSCHRSLTFHLDLSYSSFIAESPAERGAFDGYPSAVG